MTWRRDKFETVRALLFREWDPLEVNDNPRLCNEYDRYIADILRLLDGHCTAAELERHLAKMEAEEMGLAPAPEKTAAAAQAVVADWTDKG